MTTLRNLFDLDTGGWLSWYTKSDRYSRAKLNADLESLRSYYLTRGYLEFRIESTQVAISPDKDDMTITINISEGLRYAVSKVELQGDFLGKEAEFKSLVTLKAGEAYNVEDMNTTVKAFTDYFGAFGYAFAQVEAVPEIDRVNNRVAFVLRAQPARALNCENGISGCGNTAGRSSTSSGASICTLPRTSLPSMRPLSPLTPGSAPSARRPTRSSRALTRKAVGADSGPVQPPSSSCTTPCAAWRCSRWSRPVPASVRCSACMAAAIRWI